MTVWELVPDLGPRRRLLLGLRVGLALVTVLVAVVLGRAIGAVGALVTVAVAAPVAMVVQAWGRSTPDLGPQRVWVDDGALFAEGPDLYVRRPGDDGFDRQATAAGPLVQLGEVVWAAVYPATTRADETPAPPLEFHLVVDTLLETGERRCVVFDRRIPFRIPGEQALAEAMQALVSEHWSELPPTDAFGEVDERRLSDWRAAARR